MEIHLRGTWSSWLTACGAVGTALAAMIAVLMLLYGVRSERSERAAEIRGDLASFAHASEMLLGHVMEGSALVTAVTNIHDELLQRVDDSADMDAIEDYLGDEQLRLSVVVAGLNRPGSVARIDAALNGLQNLSDRLDGRLMIFRAIHHLSEEVVRNSFSAEPFMEILGSLVADDATFPADPGELRAMLHATTSTRVGANYLTISAGIDGLVQALVAGVIALPDNTLMTLSRPLSRDTHERLQQSGRHSDAISILLTELRWTIGEQKFESLTAALAELNASLN